MLFIGCLWWRGALGDFIFYLNEIKALPYSIQFSFSPVHRSTNGMADVHLAKQGQGVDRAVPLDALTG